MYLLIYFVCFLTTFIKIYVDAGLASQQQQPIYTERESSDPFDPSFDEYVEDLLKECHVPGVSIAVVDNGRIASKGYGFAVLPDQKATADTQYFTASTTKAFTAAAAGLIVHDNVNFPNIHWTSPINLAIREDFVLEDEWATNHVTLEDALSHRTGLADHDLIYGREGDTVGKVVQRLRYLPLTAEPRVEWQYCNVMYAVVTGFIQAITGQSLEPVLRQWLWEPLGMRSTTFTMPSTEAGRSKLARGYYWNANADNSSGATKHGHYVTERYDDLSAISGAGATISTVNDYSLWIRALIDAADGEESWNASNPISPRLLRDLVSPRSIVPVFGQPDRSQTFVPPLYALGWVVATIGRQTLLAHSGGTLGFGTELFILPGLKYGVVTMQNTLSSDDYQDAGAIVASRLVLEKLGFTGSHMVESLAAQNSVLDMRKATVKSAMARHRRQSTPSKFFGPTLQPEARPLPLSLCDFAGIYSHPAYGILNLTVNVASASSSQRLEGIFARTFSEKEVLTHISGTLFSVKSFEPHGLGDIVSEQGIVWEDVSYGDGKAYAVFELAPDGKGVDMLGIELDPDMIEHVRKKGNSSWREGMVWFKKVQ